MTHPHATDTSGAAGGPLAPAPAAALGILSARGIACRRGRRLLFRDLDLNLQPGALIWLRGRNGSGKTSLLRALAGLGSVEAGSIGYGAPGVLADSVAARHAWRSQLIYIGHANALKDDLSLAESLAFLARLHGQDAAPPQLQAALRSFDVAQRADAPVRTLSQGQRRRGALSRLALGEQPRHWLLDEPFDALDRDGIERLVALLVANAARGGSVLFTSHQSVALPGVVEFDLEACCEPGSANRAAVRNRDG